MPRRLGARTADHDLATGSARAEPMDVRVSAGRHEPARPAGAARAIGRLRGDAEQAGREVQRQRRLARRPPARRAGPHEAPVPGSSPSPRRARPRVPGSGRHPRRGSGGLALDRRSRGLAGAASLGGGRRGGFRSVRAGRLHDLGRRGGLAGRPALGCGSLGPGRLGSDGGVRRDRRWSRGGLAGRPALGCGCVSASRAPTGEASVTTSAVPASSASAAAVVALRVVRRFGAGASAGVALVGAASGAVAVAGLPATWARSIASSSGGTSLHGSLDERGAASRSRGRSSRPRPRPSSRGAPPRPPCEPCEPPAP